MNLNATIFVSGALIPVVLTLFMYVPTLTCPVTVYTSTHVVESPLASGVPWLPVSLLILVGVCLAGGVYAVMKRGANA